MYMYNASHTWRWVKELCVDRCGGRNSRCQRAVGLEVGARVEAPVCAHCKRNLRRLRRLCIFNFVSEQCAQTTNGSLLVYRFVCYGCANYLSDFFFHNPIQRKYSIFNRSIVTQIISSCYQIWADTIVNRLHTSFSFSNQLIMFNVYSESIPVVSYTVSIHKSTSIK